MALKGTLRDFGIADILQLIGQQQKTGVLHLKNADLAVNVHFVDGNVVKAESATRSKRDLLGRMMVRSRVLTEAQLERALDQQKRTLRRLGDILVAEGMTTRETFREIYQLQTTETLFKLFHWEDGTYEFEQKEVDWDQEAITPIRSENVLMEGFRMVDEWPMIRRRINSYEMTFAPRSELPEPAGDGGLSSDHDPFDGLEPGDSDDGPGPSERRVYALVTPELTVQDLVDLARLGEFETCKALYNLVEAGILEARAPRTRGNAAPLAAVTRRSPLGMLRRGFVQLVVGLAVLAGFGALAWLAMGLPGGVAGTFRSRAAVELVADAERARLERAIEVYRLSRGERPETLAALAEADLVAERELSYPYGTPWYYRRDEATPQGYVLLPPLP